MNEYKWAILYYNGGSGYHFVMYKKYAAQDVSVAQMGNWKWFLVDGQQSPHGDVTVFQNKRNAIRQFRKKYNVRCIPKFTGEKIENIVKMMKII